MEAIFISKLNYLRINKNLNKGKQIFNDLRISNSNNFIKRHLDKTLFKEQIGMLEYENLFDSAYMYAINKSMENKTELSNSHLNDIVNKYLVITQWFTTILWLIKDHSIYTELGFFLLPRGADTFSVTSGSRTNAFLNSEGESKEVEFTESEIQLAIDLFSSIGDKEHFENTDSDKHLVSTQSNRIERFVYFLQSARTQGNIPSRIALYCTMLEALVSTNTTKGEITYQLSERIAFMIGSSFEERVMIFNSIKQAYKIRSSAVHGSLLDRKLRPIERQIEVSREMDNILREIFKKIICDSELVELFFDTDDQDGKRIDNYFQELIFGKYK